MQRLGDRPQPIEQRTGTFAQLVQAGVDPADVAEQRHELAFDREVAIGLEGGDSRHVAERAQPPPCKGAGALGLLELGLDLGTNGTFGGLGGRAIGLQAGDQGGDGGGHGRPS